MKKNIFLLLCLLKAFSILANQLQQPGNTPAQAAFSKSYPGALYATWQTLDANTYAVRFVHNNQSCVAYYDSDGTPLGCGKMMLPENTASIPEKVTNALNNLFSVYQVLVSQEWVLQKKRLYYFELILPDRRLSVCIGQQGNIYGRRLLRRL